MKRILLLGGAALALYAAHPADAWWTNGHSIIAEAAVRALPADVPGFIRKGAAQVAHCAQDPDVSKNSATPINTNREEPEHFIDWELLGGRALPPNRYDFIRECYDAHQDPRKVGLLPYATAEWTERLAVAFAEYRRWPDNPYIPSKCLVYAGILSHYTGDLCQPLHCTVHYDGRVGPDGSSAHTGIHAAVDSLVEKLGFRPDELARGQKVEPVEALLPAIRREIEQSRSQIDRTYALDAALPRRGAWSPTPEVTRFGTERAREATRFSAAMLLTAWRKSASITIPGFIQREAGPNTAR